MQIQLSDISKYRSELMGIATIGILVCHAGSRGVVLGSLLPIFNMGQVGNALFFLLSGFGLYFSISKIEYSNLEILRWYKKRLVRIFVPYFMWCLPFLIYQLVEYPDTDWLSWLYVFSLLSYWDGSGGVAWFLSVLVALYFLAPLIYKLVVYRGAVMRNTLIIAIIFSVLYFVRTGITPIDLAISNIPNIFAFILGICLGYYCKSEVSVHIGWFFLSGIIAYVLFFCYHSDSSMMHLGSCLILLPILVYIFNRFQYKHTTLQCLGSISLESYLTNGALPRVVAFVFPLCGLSVYNTGNYLGYTIVVVLGLALSWLLHTLSQQIIKRL